jgi:tetratricopeptide (TPR) repeat protein
MHKRQEREMNTPADPIGDTEPTVDHLHPWLGLASFSEESRSFFYGREEEVAELARRVQRKLLTVLFGQSGLGKTSILRAGLVPRLRNQGYCPVYVRVDYNPDAPTPAQQIKQAILRETAASGTWTRVGVAVENESLWEFLHHRDDLLQDAQGKSLMPLLIFDQFEEIFTLAQSDDVGRERAAQFIEGLAELVENRPSKALEAKLEEDDSAVERFDFSRCDYRVLITLREDYLAHLEGLKGDMPSITQNRMRLAPMTGQQALAAVTGPGGSLVSEEVAQAIVRFVAGGAELANAQVEPSLLSLICRELNDKRIAAGRSEISLDLLAGSHASILSDFYERALHDQPEAVRCVIEDMLLTDSGFRENVAEERLVSALSAAGAAPDALPVLVNRRLLRIEERLDARRVELTHDVLCSVVQSSRLRRQEREAREAGERMLAAQRERERATRHTLVRTRQVAAGCMVLAVCAIGASIYAYASAQRARQAEVMAEQTRTLADKARTQAEGLTGYLLDDLYYQLEPFGRLEVIGGLANRSLTYYSGLPAELQSNDTARNRARAEARLAAVLRRQGKSNEALTKLDDAVPTLERLYQNGDHAESTLIGLGFALQERAKISRGAHKNAEALADTRHAIELMKPAAEAQDASKAVKQQYGDLLEERGFLLMRDRQREQAIADLKAAREVMRSMDGLQLSNLPAAAGYIETGGWLIEALTGNGQVQDAESVGKDSLAVAAQILEKYPSHLKALRSVALINDQLTFNEVGDMNATAALAHNNESIRVQTELLRFDPDNQISRHNLAVCYLLRGVLNWFMGKPTEAVAAMQTAINGLGQINLDPFSAINLRTFAARQTDFLSEMGQTKEAESAYQTARRASEVQLSGEAAGSFSKSLVPIELKMISLRRAQTEGAHAGVLQEASPLIQSVQALKPARKSDQDEFNDVLRHLYQIDAESAYEIKDFARAEKSAREGLEVAKHSDLRMGFELSEVDDLKTDQALALARLGRTSEALELTSVVLKRQRTLQPRAQQDQMFRIEVARTLLAIALAKPETAQRDLKEAHSLLASLSPDVKRLRYTMRWQQHVDETLKATH